MLGVGGFSGWFWFGGLLVLGVGGFSGWFWLGGLLVLDFGPPAFFFKGCWLVRCSGFHLPQKCSTLSGSDDGEPWKLG